MIRRRYAVAAELLAIVWSSAMVSVCLAQDPNAADSRPTKSFPADPEGILNMDSENAESRDDGHALGSAVLREHGFGRVRPELLEQPLSGIRLIATDFNFAAWRRVAAFTKRDLELL